MDHDEGWPGADGEPEPPEPGDDPPTHDLTPDGPDDYDTGDLGADPYGEPASGDPAGLDGSEPPDLNPHDSGPPDLNPEDSALDDSAPEAGSDSAGFGADGFDADAGHDPGPDDSDADQPDHGEGQSEEGPAEDGQDDASVEDSATSFGAGLDNTGDHDGSWHDDEFPGPLDLGGEPPEPVDGYPWADPDLLGAPDPAQLPDPGADVGPADPDDLLSYAGLDSTGDADPWSLLRASDDPATSALARWWGPPS
jgi:hypothetical protein